jgi:hypothetical protein
LIAIKKKKNKTGQVELDETNPRAVAIARRLIESERLFANDIDTLLNSYWIPLVICFVSFCFVLFCFVCFVCFD